MSVNTNALWYKAYQFVLDLLAKITWTRFRNFFIGKDHTLTDDDLNFIRKSLDSDYYIIATRRNTHLTTYLISIGGFLTTGKFGYYNHVLMNIEGDNPLTDDDFLLMESTGELGVHYTKFMEVFDCDSVALLRPKNTTKQEWEEAVEAMKKDLGKPYDDAIDFSQDKKASCVQMVNDSLEGMHDYNQKFPHLIALIKKYGRLTPQQFYECEDFEVVWEVRRK
jgi:hypothetical protein